ncbi:MAG: hypothetical protein AB1649_20865 [Chloroflexota bacterium]
MDRKDRRFVLAMIVAVFILILACATVQKSVPQTERWGIYSMDLTTQETSLIYSASRELQGLSLNSRGDTLVFAQKMDGDSNEHFEINTIGVNGTDFTRLTSNSIWDIYPAWSADDSQIAFLSWRETDLDIYVMNADGSDPHLRYNSGGHDADIDWVGDRIVFTSHSQIWSMKSDGTDAVQVSDPPKAGEWGEANLPFGDYDPRLSPDGAKIVFERLEDDTDPQGNYNLYVINVDGTGEIRLTSDSYAQGLAEWSHAGDKIVYVVAAINGSGQYDMYIINADGTDAHNITPEYFSAIFLVRTAVFSGDDSKIYFIGEWWK